MGGCFAFAASLLLDSNFQDSADPPSQHSSERASKSFLIRTYNALSSVVIPSVPFVHSYGDESLRRTGFHEVAGDDCALRNRGQDVLRSCDIGNASSKETCLGRLPISFNLYAIDFLIISYNRESEELAEVEAELDADLKANAGAAKDRDKDNKAFSITFFGEWGDKSQIATIGLAADENPLGVVLGGILGTSGCVSVTAGACGQALCTIAAVLGGKSLASQISERAIALAGGVLFIVFGIQSLLSPVD
nr:GDT1-like protein 5 [Ipomoea trifida]